VGHNVRELGGLVRLSAWSDATSMARRYGRCAARDRHRRRHPDESRPTTRKMRVVTSRNQQVARIDYESDREARGDEAAAGRAGRGRCQPGRWSSPTT
jgi:bifunctional ADP-heptose synthase (sugar kinase/adenylyltransferase)